ncbi:hypothetical protein FGO68_gene8854 [Halteria grandinella]|uniref:Uncharacterized protein n=1 Tax=Halteria grandinella TaxID=5974 RepID=A0A8J8T9P0_HALGN|nr:hypothetical protein FGO68_gene8854 [Halteria grandinella]
MIQNGDFYATQYQYIFITKYMKAMENSEDGYDKLILFPPPLNFFLVPLILVSPWRSLTRKLGRFIAYFFFWGENILLVFGFYAYMVLHNPLIIVKTLYQIMTKIDGALNKVTYSLTWTIIGLAYLMYVNVMDSIMLVKLLCLENSVVFVHGEEERNKNETFTFYVNRNVIRAIKTLKDIGDKSSVVFHKRQNVQRMQTQKMSLREKIKNQQNEMRNEDIFIVRKELIIAVYEEISGHDPYVQRHRMQQILLNQEQNQNRQSTSMSQGQGMNASSTQASIALLLKSAIQNTKQHSVKNIYGEVDPQISPELKGIISKLMLSKNRDSIGELVEYMLKVKEKKNYFQITEEEAWEVDNFISKFTILQQNQETMTIDLDLVSKGFPKQVSKHGIKKTQLLNFQKMQRILISFFNDDQDEMFNYYDNRMTRRLDILRDSTQQNSTHLDRILEVTKNVFNYIFFKEHINRINSMRRNTTFIGENISLNGQNTMLMGGSTMGGQSDASNRRKSTLMSQITQMYNENQPQRQETIRRQSTISQFMRQATINKNPQNPQTQQFLSPNLIQQTTQSNLSGGILDHELDKNKNLMKHIQQKYQNEIIQMRQKLGLSPVEEERPAHQEQKKMSTMVLSPHGDAPMIFINRGDTLHQQDAAEGSIAEIPAPSNPRDQNEGLENQAQNTTQNTVSNHATEREQSPTLEPLVNIDMVLDLDRETKIIQQRVNMLRQKRELMIKQQQLQALQAQAMELNTMLTPPRQLFIQDVDQSSQNNTSIDLSTSNNQNSVQRVPSLVNAPPQPASRPSLNNRQNARLSFLHTFVQQPTMTGPNQIEILANQTYHNYMTSVLKQGTIRGGGDIDDLDSSHHGLDIEVPLTAEQILEQIRAQRKERSHDGGSNFSNNEVQEFSAADFSSFITQKRTLLQQATLVYSSGNNNSGAGAVNGSKNSTPNTRGNGKQVSGVSMVTNQTIKPSLFPSATQKRPSVGQRREQTEKPIPNKRLLDAGGVIVPMDSFRSDSESEYQPPNGDNSNNKGYAINSKKTVKEREDGHY